jgi:hypothetical protein
MSLTLVAATAGPTASTPQGARHQRLQLWWWPLPDLPPAPPGGPAIDVSNSGGGRCRTCRQHPQGVCHLRLQLRWWPLLDMPLAPTRGPAIDVSDLSGGRCRPCHQHPLGGPLRFR